MPDSGGVFLERDSMTRITHKVDSKRDLRNRVHNVFDRLWKKAKCKRTVRNAAYRWLAEQMDMDVEQCHFRKMNREQLYQALRLIRSVDTRGIICWNKRCQVRKRLFKGKNNDA